MKISTPVIIQIAASIGVFYVQTVVMDEKISKLILKERRGVFEKIIKNKISIKYYIKQRKKFLLLYLRFLGPNRVLYDRPKLYDS